MGNTLKDRVLFVRQRPGMFVGNRNVQGLNNMLGLMIEELIENANSLTEIAIDFNADDSIKIKAIGVDANAFINTLTDADTNTFFFALPSIIGLSEFAEIIVNRPPLVLWFKSNQGDYSSAASTSQSETDSIELCFKPDNSIFENVGNDYEIFNSVFKKYALLNRNIKIISQDKRTSPEQSILFYYPNGLSHLIDYKIGRQFFNPPRFRLDLNSVIGEYSYQVCICVLDCSATSSCLTTFANNDELIHGGSLIDGIFSGIVTAFRKVSGNNKIKKKKVLKHLLLVASVKGKSFKYTGGTKTALNMPAMKKEIKHFVSAEIQSHLITNPTLAEKVIAIFTV